MAPQPSKDKQADRLPMKTKLVQVKQTKNQIQSMLKTIIDIDEDSQISHSRDKNSSSGGSVSITESRVNSTFEAQKCLELEKPKKSSPYNPRMLMDVKF